MGGRKGRREGEGEGGEGGKEGGRALGKVVANRPSSRKHRDSSRQFHNSTFPALALRESQRSTT